jgi:hypothetical protein
LSVNTFYTLPSGLEPGMTVAAAPGAVLLMTLIGLLPNGKKAQNKLPLQFPSTLRKILNTVLRQFAIQLSCGES